MKKSFVLFFGVVAYVLGSGALVYLIAFLFNLVPENPWLGGIDGQGSASVPAAVLLNLVLIAFFGVQHSLMARSRFKRWIRRYIPEAAERSTYLVATAVAVLVLCVLWQPIGGVVWQANHTVIHYGLMAAGLGGWLLVLYSTFLINHFDLFGLRQAWLYFRDSAYTPLEFRKKGLYRWIRHPIMTGAFIGIWLTPVMTYGHLLFAAGMSLYIFIGVYYEERDLIRTFGARYLHYIHKTGKFFPGVRAPSSRSSQATS